MNALEDFIEAYLRKEVKCSIVERNIWLKRGEEYDEDGEIDAIGIKKDSGKGDNVFFICEATAASDVYGNETQEVVKRKLTTAKEYLKNNLLWVNPKGKITAEFWAPYISLVRRKQIEAIKIPDLKIKVINGGEFLRRTALLKKHLVGADIKTLAPTLQIIALLAKIPVVNQKRYSKGKTV